MTDPKKLHKKFIQLGRMRHKLKNELLVILPEIYKSDIYKKYASSIVEYAGKYGDIAKSTVIKRLRLEKKLEEKPCLKEAIKEVGIHKVAIVVNLATPETDETFADKVKNMSKSAVQTLAKELREKKKLQAEMEGGMETKKELSSAFLSRCQASSEKIKIELDEEMSFMFLKLKKKLGKNLSNRELMRMILGKMVEEEFPAKKSRVKSEEMAETKGKEIAKSVTGDTLTDERKNGETVDESRYIMVKKRRMALAETEGKCGYPNCNKPAEIFHHRERFAENRSHDSVVPLCKAHHEFAHNGIIENEKQKSECWRLDIHTKPKHKTDHLYRIYRKSKA